MRRAERCELLVVAETLQLPLANGERVFANNLCTALKLQPGVIVLSALRDQSEAPPVADGVVTASRTILTPDLVRRAKTLRPRRILYIPEASFTLAAAMRARVLGWMFRAPVSVLSLQSRTYGNLARLSVRALAPDCVLVPSQSYASELLESLGVTAISVGIGAPDPNRFAAVNSARRAAARDKLGIAPTACVYLHVGHVQQSRNLEALATLASDSELVIIVGSPISVDLETMRLLENRSVRVEVGYVESIEDYYHAADVYVFAVESRTGCIEVPVSVLEAMACDLPVAATAFGALPEIVGSHPAVSLSARAKDVPASARRLAADYSAVRADTRQLIRDQTWLAVADRVLRAVRGDSDE